MRSGIIKLPKITDPRGNLTVADGRRNIPFDIRRVYWTYDIPAGEWRGGHAHKSCKELIIAASGSFSVTLDDGMEKETFRLSRPYEGLYVDTGVWRTLDDFSSGALCLVLTSELFDEQDYIRDYDDFIDYVRCRQRK